jgi:hypothetical protein
LYGVLQSKNDELLAGIMADYVEVAGRTREQAETNVRDNLRVTVIVTGANGEQVVTHDASGLDERHLPSVITAIALDSAWLMRLALQGQDSVNRCHILFDFDRPALIDLSNASGEPTPNSSNYRVVAANATWGVALADSIKAEFSGRALGRAWLHGTYTYDVLLLLVGFPIALWTAWRIWDAAPRHVTWEGTALPQLLVVYLFLLALYVFRCLFGVARWLWPYVELRRERQGAATVFWRFVLGSVALGILTTLIYDIARAIVAN